MMLPILFWVVSRLNPLVRLCRRESGPRDKKGVYPKDETLADYAYYFIPYRGKHWPTKVGRRKGTDLSGQCTDELMGFLHPLGIKIHSVLGGKTY